MRRAANPSSRATATATIPEAKWHGAWILSGLLPASRCEHYGRSERLAGGGRQRERKGPGLLPTCGTPVYLTFVAMPELIAVHATSLDDPSQFNPQLVTYGIRGHAGTRGFLAADIRANAAWLSVEDAIEDTTVIHPRYAAQLVQSS